MFKCYLKKGMLEPWYYGVISWNDVTVIGWVWGVGIWFGTFSVPGTRIRERWLVYPLFVVQTMLFGIPNAFRMRGDWVEHSIEYHEVHNGNDV